MLELRNITKSYNNKQIITDVNLSVVEGEIFGIVGKSGAGKSTLLKIINLLERPNSGSVILNKIDLVTLSKAQLLENRRNIGMIFQHFNLIENKNIFDNVAFPLIISGKFTSAEIKAKVTSMLQLVDLSAHAMSYPSNLSGGQKQRVGIARALITNPSLLLCDEATSALDPETTSNILELLLEINQKLRITIILITHEVDVIRKICDRVAVMDHGKLVEVGETAHMLLEPTHMASRKIFIEEEVIAYIHSISDSYVFQKNSTHYLLLLSFIGDVTYQPVMHTIGLLSDVKYSILRGSIGKLKNQAFGQLLVDFDCVAGIADVSDVLDKFNVSYQLIGDIE